VTDAPLFSFINRYQIFTFFYLEDLEKFFARFSLRLGRG